VVHLGHQGNECPHAGPFIKNFTVVDVTGIHTINIHFCGCIGAPHPRRQLLAVSWFPASLDQPQTAFTLDVLDTFQLLNLQGKISVYDFYYSLDHKTDNTGTLGIKVCDLLVVIAVCCLCCALGSLPSIPYSYSHISSHQDAQASRSWE
jgi:hypothetical protein